MEDYQELRCCPRHGTYMALNTAPQQCPICQQQSTKIRPPNQLETPGEDIIHK